MYYLCGQIGHNMRKFANYMGIILWVCIGLFACQPSKHKTAKAVASDSPSAKGVACERLEGNRQLVHNETYHCDTTIDDIHIVYTLQENGDTVCSYPYVERITFDSAYMERDTVYYAVQTCIFSIEDSRGIILHRSIDRDFFAAFIPRSDLPYYILHSVRLQRYDSAERKMYFEVMLCVPDTDICYSFLLIVSAQGLVVQEELEDAYPLFSISADSIYETKEHLLLQNIRLLNAMGNVLFEDSMYTYEATMPSVYRYGNDVVHVMLEVFNPLSARTLRVVTINKDNYTGAGIRIGQVIADIDNDGIIEMVGQELTEAPPCYPCDSDYYQPFEVYKLAMTQVRDITMERTLTKQVYGCYLESPTDTLLPINNTFYNEKRLLYPSIK